MRTIKAKCFICGYEESYSMNKKESDTLDRYELLGRQMGYIQDLFPEVPAWIRSGAIDQFSGGFCICPHCQ